MKRLVFAVVLVALAAIALLFAALNHEPVGLELAFVELRLPLGLALVTAFVIGLLLGVLWRVRWVAQLLIERGRLRRALRLAEAQARTALEGRRGD